MVLTYIKLKKAGQTIPSPSINSRVGIHPDTLELIILNRVEVDEVPLDWPTTTEAPFVIDPLMQVRWGYIRGGG